MKSYLLQGTSHNILKIKFRKQWVNYQSSKIPKQTIITKPQSCVCISISHLLYRNFGAMHLMFKIIRIITYSFYLAHIDEIFKELNILPVYKLKLQRICLQMFKYANNALPEAITELFISNAAHHSYNTRNKQNLRFKVSKRA